MMRFEGKVAIVSGGTKTSGATIASRLAELGAAVVVAGRSTVDGEAVAERIRSEGGTANFSRTDVTVEADVHRTVEVTSRTFGRLDIVVNNAAALDLIRTGTADPPVVEATAHAVERIMSVGFYGPLWFFKHAIPVMLRHGGGAFVSVSSTSAAVACQGLPAYSASKAALEALSRQVCADYGAAGIRSNVIRLGSMVVPGNAALHDDEAFHEASLAQVLVPRLGDPTDLANAVVFLASAESSYATASVLTLDGGASAFLATPNVATAWRHIVE